MTNVNWHGVFAAVTTQFREDGALDVAATLEHLDFLVDQGLQGLIILGTVGEGTSLSADEKLELTRAVVGRFRGEVPVLVGVAENTTREACRFAAAVEKIGADGLMVLPAMVYHADEQEVQAHLRMVARSTGLPIMVYNNPVAYKVDIPPHVFRSLADEENLVAIKESSEDSRRITDLAVECGDRYLLFVGIDDLAMEGALLGARGWVGGLVNAFPREGRILWDLLQEGRLDEARELYRWYTPLLHLDARPKLVQCIKLVMAEVGLGREVLRLPRLPLQGSEREEVLNLLRKALATRPDLAVPGRSQVS
ncbi:MAG: dihydrodipicolinate synthase family protein [Acidobacteriota bacterium]